MAAALRKPDSRHWNYASVFKLASININQTVWACVCAKMWADQAATEPRFHVETEPQHHLICIYTSSALPIHPLCNSWIHLEHGYTHVQREINLTANKKALRQRWCHWHEIKGSISFFAVLKAWVNDLCTFLRHRVEKSFHIFTLNTALDPAITHFIAIKVHFKRL